MKVVWNKVSSQWACCTTFKFVSIIKSKMICKLVYKKTISLKKKLFHEKKSLVLKIHTELKKALSKVN